MKTLSLFLILASFLLSVGCTSVSPRNFEVETFAPPLSMKSKLKVAAVQFPIQGGQSQDGFLQKIENTLQMASEQKVELVVLPELISLDLWPKNSKKSERDIVLEIAKFTPEYLKQMQAFAKKFKVDVVAGSVPILEEEKLFNRSYFVSKKGDVQFQDKIMLTPWGKKTGFATSEQIRPIITDWGFFILLICYDVESPSVSNFLTKLNIELPLIVVPSMTESEEGYRRVQYTSQARAVEHHTYVVVAGTVGMAAKDWVNVGQGQIYGPQAPGFPAVIKQGPKDKAGLVIETLDLAKLRESQSKREFYPASEPTPFK